MPEQPLTDAELHAFLALDDARTAEEWIDMAGTPFEGEIHTADDFATVVVMLPDLDDRPHDLAYIAGCTRVARRMAEELVRRREAARELTDALGRIGREDDTPELDAYHEDETYRLRGV